MPGRGLLASLAIVVLSVGACACGSSGKSTVAVSQAAGSGGEEAGTHYLNDGDNDPSSDNDGDDESPGEADDDNDYQLDHPNPKNHSYHDSDDGHVGIDRRVLDFGHAADATDTRAVSAAVQRYYSLAAADNGTAACQLMISSLAGALVEDYANAPGPSYLRGANSCQAVLSRVFKREHAQVTHAFVVTGVLIEGNSAVALMGSTEMPASDIRMQREGGVWKVTSLLGSPLE